MNNSISSTKFIKEAQEYQKGRVCSICKKHKPLSEFYNDKTSKHGLQYKCKSCKKEYHDNLCPFYKWFLPKRVPAQKRGIEFTIEPEDIPGVKIREVITKSRSNNGYGSFSRIWKSWEAVEYPKVCPVFGMELDWGMNGRQPNSPSLDRIDPTKGYVKGNVMLISDLANSMKQNATPEQLKQFSRYHLFGNNNG
tara:strand:- start:37 stop:618 length:582 start_codon:yes stop_codon:yes gene_type:complete